MKSNGKIVAVHESISKETTMGKNNVVVLESKWFKTSRNKSWHKTYANVAYQLCKQGHIVFISTEKDVLGCLKINDIEFTIVCPSQELTELYNESIEPLLLENKCITVKTMDYNLYDIAVYGCENIRRDVFGMFDNLVLNF